jgi:hypothetical protein
MAETLSEAISGIGVKKRFDFSVGAWLDRLMRPNYAVANTVLDMVDEGEFHPLESVWRGLTGRDKTLFSDVLSEAGWYPETKTGEFTKFVAGLGLDIALDPLTYVGIGGFTKAGKLAKVKEGARVTKLLKAGIPLERATSILTKAQKAGKITTFLPPTKVAQVASGQRALLKFAGIPVVKGKKFYEATAKLTPKFSQTPLSKLFQVSKTPPAKAIREAEERITALAGKEVNEARKIKLQIDKVAKRYNRSYDDVAGIIGDFRERPAFKIRGGIPISDPEVAGLVKRVSTRMDKIFEVEKSIGKLGAGLMEDELEYFTHILTPSGKKWLIESAGKRIRGEGKRLTTNHVSLLPRRIRDMDISSINTWAKSKGFTGDKFFHTDPAIISAVRGARHNKIMVSHGLFKKLKGMTDYVQPENIAPRNWQTLPVAELKGFKVAPDIMRDLERVYKTATSPTEIQEFIKFYDKWLLNPWKVTTLAPFPAYHARNMIGNAWNNWLAGIKNPLSYIDAAKLQKARKYGGKFLKRQITKDLNAEQVLRLAEDLGVLERGWYATVERLAGSKGVTDLPILKQGLAVGRTIEHNARVAHFIEMLRKGISPEAAATSVKKFLFDYNELTTFEKQVMRRIFPFYTWSRKNIPLQLENIVRQPGKGLFIPKVKEETWAAVGRPDRKYEPDWIKRRMPMFVGHPKTSEFSYFPLESWIPYADIQKLSRPADIVGEMLTPFIKVPIELTTNKIYYFDQPIEDYPGETEEFLRVDLPAWVAYLGRQVRGLNTVHRMLGYTEKSATQPPQPSTAERYVRFFTGIKVSRYDIEKAKRVRKWETKKELEKLRIGLSRSKKYGRTREAERIIPNIQKLEAELDEL